MRHTEIKNIGEIRTVPVRTVAVHIGPRILLPYKIHFLSLYIKDKDKSSEAPKKTQKFTFCTHFFALLLPFLCTFKKPPLGEMGFTGWRPEDAPADALVNS